MKNSRHTFTQAKKGKSSRAEEAVTRLYHQRYITALYQNQKFPFAGNIGETYKIWKIYKSYIFIWLVICINIDYVEDGGSPYCCLVYIFIICLSSFTKNNNLYNHDRLSTHTNLTKNGIKMRQQWEQNIV